MLRRTPSRCIDRKSTRLNSSHVSNSYAVFCLKKKRKKRGMVGHKTRSSMLSCGPACFDNIILQRFGVAQGEPEFAGITEIVVSVRLANAGHQAGLFRGGEHDVALVQRAGVLGTVHVRQTLPDQEAAASAAVSRRRKDIGSAG